MLILSRRTGESLVLDGRIVVTVQRIAGNRVTLTVDAPGDVTVARGCESREQDGRVPAVAEASLGFENLD